MKNDVKSLQAYIVDLEKMLEFDKNLLEKQIIEKSAYLERVKEEVEAYRKYKRNIDDINKVFDKIGELRDYLLEITEDNYPEIYEEFIRDIYDENPYETLIFMRRILQKRLER